MPWENSLWGEESVGFGELIEKSNMRLEELNRQLGLAQRQADDFDLKKSLLRGGVDDQRQQATGNIYWRYGSKEFGGLEELQARLDSIQDTLTRQYGSAPVDMDHKPFDLDADSSWTLGTQRRLIGSKDMLRGKIMLAHDVRLVQPLRLITVMFLKTIGIPGLKDELCRERHGHLGYHYHYCVVRKGRSDTILSFGDLDVKAGKRVLHHEKHGETKAKAVARPDAWADEKRQSVWGVCAPDLNTWNISEFKKPGQGAGIVWPR